jgi:4a-hydroxytetrahydrobiopterin dehydratase
MPTELLSDDEVQALLDELPDWDIENGKLHRNFQFEDFQTAFGFMTSVALAAEAAGHHPEWWNTYNKVEVWLSTHSAGGITTKDADLAREMDRLAR